MGEGELM